MRKTLNAYAYTPPPKVTLYPQNSLKLFNSLPDTNECENLILIGDFNTTMDPNLDRKDSAIKYQKLKTSK